jgi:hypothetical protein
LKWSPTEKTSFVGKEYRPFAHDEIAVVVDIFTRQKISDFAAMAESAEPVKQYGANIVDEENKQSDLAPDIAAKAKDHDAKIRREALWEEHELMCEICGTVRMAKETCPRGQELSGADEAGGGAR